MDYRLYFQSRQGEMVHFLKQIVGMESPTADKKAVDACATFVTRELRKIGCKTTVLPQKEIGNLHILEFGAGRKKDLDGEILVLTHIDTVWPVGKIEKMPFYVSGKKVFGPGVLDMKAGLAMVFFSLSTIRSLSLKPGKRITVFINSAEETGHKSAHEVIRRLARKSSYILCLEPAVPGGALKMERKGRLVVRLDVRGRSAHAGSPEKGINACEELMAQLQRLKKFKTGETTINIGRIQGGDKANVVPDNAWALLDIRFWKSRDKEKILNALREMKPVMKGAHIKYTVQSTMPPMEKTKASSRLFERASEIASSLEISLSPGKTGGGSDASIASALGIPTLDGLGPDGDGIHAEKEHLLLPSFIERTALLTELLIKL